MSVGKYLIEYSAKNEWKISWHTGEGRQYIRISDLESKIGELVENTLFHQSEFVKMFSVFMMESEEVFIKKYEDIAKYLPKDLDKVNYELNSASDIFQAYLSECVIAYNKRFNTNLKTYDIDPLIGGIRIKIV